MEVYEKWFVHSFTLEYIPTVAMTVAGTVHIAPDYDPVDTISTSASTMSNAYGYKGGPVSQRLVCHMPNIKEVDGNWTRPALYCSPGDIDRLVSYGFFDVIVEGTTAALYCGRLVLHYDVTFIKPCPYQVYAIAKADQVITLAGDNTDIKFPTDISAATNANKFSLSVTNMASSIYSGVISAFDAGASLLTKYGRVIQVGQRVFYKLASAHISSSGAGILTSPATTAILGAISLSRDFAPRNLLGATAASSALAIGVRDVVQL